MKILTCRICGEVYLGKEFPQTCPFCGVNKRYLWPAKVWKDEGVDIELSDISKNNIEKALNIELSNTAFYLEAYKNLTNQEISLMFKGLADVENEHANVFRKLLKREKRDDVIVNEVCKDDDKKAIQESAIREKRAVDFYAQAMGEASEPWIKEVFKAIMETETDHLELDNNYLN